MVEPRGVEPRTFSLLTRRSELWAVFLMPSNVDGEIASLTTSDPPNQAEVQALCDETLGLADDLRNRSSLGFRG